MERVVKAYSDKSRERGANLVEFALLAPLLIMLLFGIIEFGWLFSVNLDVRHGAREGARMAATDDLGGTPVSTICGRMDLANDPQTTVAVSRTGDQIGDDITVTIANPANSLTGIMDWAIPASLQLTSTITVRQEQVPSWATISTTNCP